MQTNSYLMARADSLKGLRRTGRDCNVCEDGTFLKDGSELICDTCQYVPDSREPTESQTPWQQFRKLRAQAAEDNERPYCVGGAPGAYWGDGEYEYEPASGFRGPE